MQFLHFRECCKSFHARAFPNHRLASSAETPPMNTVACDQSYPPTQKASSSDLILAEQVRHSEHLPTTGWRYRPGEPVSPFASMMCKVTVECLAGPASSRCGRLQQKLAQATRPWNRKHLPRPPPSFTHGARSGDSGAACASSPEPCRRKPEPVAAIPVQTSLPPRRPITHRRKEDGAMGGRRTCAPTDDPYRPQPYRSLHDDGTLRASKRPATPFHDSRPPPKAA